MGFTTFGLSDHIMEGVRAAGHTVPTPIQSLAIHPAMEGRDIVASAQTGTGKTAAFVLPLLHRLAAADRSRLTHRKPRALILTPTRELAQQVHDAVATYGRFLPLRGVAIFGGAGMKSQTDALRRGVDIIVATPGRLLDHLGQGNVDLSAVEILVLDEADRMLDMGFIRDVTSIIEQIPRERQTLLFSATLSPEITTLAARFLRNPQTFESGRRQNPADGITHHFYQVPGNAKMALLLHALEDRKLESVLVFSRTKHGADKICRRLERGGIGAVAIHSNRTQPQRERALEGFKQGKFRVLVATDIAARGIDVTGISHVVNFDVPRYAEDYIHRTGRTGRAGSFGEALTLASPEEQQFVKRIEQFTGKKYPLRDYPGMPADAPGSEAQAPHGNEKVPRGDARVPHRNEMVPHRNDKAPHRKEKVAKAPQNLPHRKRRTEPRGVSFVAPRKKKAPARKMETYSSGYDGGSWSNY